MAFSFATITHSFQGADQTPSSGVVEFTLERTLTNGSVTIVAGTSVVAALDVDGHLSQTLASTEDPGTICQGLAVWRSDERIVGAPARSWFFALASGAVDYGTLIATAEAFG